MLHLTAEQRDLLAEIGHFYLLLESHQSAATYCREQLAGLRQRLESSEQANPASQVSE